MTAVKILKKPGLFHQKNIFPQKNILRPKKYFCENFRKNIFWAKKYFFHGKRYFSSKNIFEGAPQPSYCSYCRSRSGCSGQRLQLLLNCLVFLSKQRFSKPVWVTLPRQGTPVRGLSERSLLIGDAASELASPGAEGCQGWSGKQWFWHAFLGHSRPGGEKRRLYGVSRHPWSASPPSAAFFPGKRRLFTQPFCDRSRRGRFSGHFDRAHKATRGGRGRPPGGLRWWSQDPVLQFCRREFQFWTSLSRTDPVLTTMILE